LGGGNPATVRACGAINGHLNCLCNRFEAPLNEIMALKPGAEALIFLALFLAIPLDLDEIGNHVLLSQEKTSRIESVSIPEMVVRW
jgi:hypothetical protein